MNLCGFLLVSCFASVTWAYPTFVPASKNVCDTMIPGHGVKPQSSESPYRILLSQKSIYSDQKLKVILEGKQGEKFAGFYVQARSPENELIGTFTPNELVKVHNCGDKEANGAHHANNKPKSKVEFIWTPPKDYQGTVFFRVTFVRKFSEFWVMVSPETSVQVSAEEAYNSSQSGADNFNEKILQSPMIFPKQNKTLNTQRVLTKRSLPWYSLQIRVPFRRYKNARFPLDSSKDFNGLGIHDFQSFNDLPMKDTFSRQQWSRPSRPSRSSFFSYSETPKSINDILVGKHTSSKPLTYSSHAYTSMPVGKLLLPLRFRLVPSIPKFGFLITTRHYPPRHYFIPTNSNFFPV